MSLFVVNRYLGDGEDDKESKSQAKSILERINEQAKLRKKLRDSGVHEESTQKSSQFEEDPDRTGRKSDSSHKKLTLTEKGTTESKSKKRKLGDKAEGLDIAKKKRKAKKGEEVKEGSEAANSDSAGRPKSSDVSTDILTASDKAESLKPKKKNKVKKTAEISNDDFVASGEKGEKKAKKKNVLSKDDDDSEKCGKVEEDNGLEEPADGDDDAESDAEVTADVDVDAKYGSHEFGGYTVLGEVQESQASKVKRVLPDWLANPSVVSADIRRARVPLDQVQGLSDGLIEKLKDNGIQDFFPVQADLIPAILQSSKPSFDTGVAGFRPHDICCSSPTGSGKTLAFVLPIVQALQTRLVCQIRVLAVLPVRDLATQVYKVFQTYCQGTPLQVGLLTGQKTFASEQQGLVKKGPRGFLCQKDIIVATPGRLVDHLNRTPGFSLEHLRFLVIDEADRMMDEIKQDWLHHVETAFLQSERSRKNDFTSFQAPLTVRTASDMFIPPQKLLFSATLSQNPEKLEQLNLFQPKLFTSVMVTKKERRADVTAEGEEGVSEQPHPSSAQVDGEFVGKYTTPSGLSEFFIQCVANQRPLLILHFLHNLNFRQVLCFTNSVESAHRLFLVVKLYGDIVVQEFSSNLHSRRRARILKRFEEGKINVLICSDAMARGMDVNNVNYVISYEPPPFIKTYIHRIGRTARAGRPGSAFTLLEKKEVYHFKKMLKGAGKEKINEHKATKSQLKKLVPKFEEALQQIPEILQAERDQKNKKRR